MDFKTSNSESSDSSLEDLTSKNDAICSKIEKFEKNLFFTLKKIITHHLRKKNSRVDSYRGYFRRVQAQKSKKNRRQASKSGAPVSRVLWRTLIAFFSIGLLLQAVRDQVRDFFHRFQVIPHALQPTF